MPTVQSAQSHQQKFSKEEEETLRVSAILFFPSQWKRKEELGYLGGGTVEDWAIGTTEMRCRGFTSNTVDPS